MRKDNLLCGGTKQKRWISKRLSVCVISRGDKKCVTEHLRICLGHESLDVTLACLKGKDAESEEVQEHANSSSLALYA
jgi:hypothetical protein